MATRNTAAAPAGTENIPDMPRPLKGRRRGKRGAQPNQAPATDAPNKPLDTDVGEDMAEAMANTPSNVAPVESKVDVDATTAAADPAATAKGVAKIRGWGKGNSDWETDKVLGAAAEALDKATSSYHVARRNYQDNVTLNNEIAKITAQGMLAQPINLPLSNGKNYQLLYGGIVNDAKGGFHRALTLDEVAEHAVGGIGRMDSGNANYASKEQVIQAALQQIDPGELATFRQVATAADPEFAKLDDAAAGMALLDAKLAAFNKVGQQEFARGRNDSRMLLNGMKSLIEAKNPNYDAYFERETGIPGFATLLRGEVEKEKAAGGDGTGVLQQAMDWLQTVNPTPYGEKTPEMLKGLANWQHLAGYSAATAGGLAGLSAMAGGGGGDDDEYLALLAAQNAQRPAY